MARLTKAEKKKQEEQEFLRRVNCHLKYYATALHEFSQRYGIKVTEFVVVSLAPNFHGKAFFVVDGVKYTAMGVDSYFLRQPDVDMHVIESLSKLIPWTTRSEVRAGGDVEVDYLNLRYYKKWE